MFYPMPGIYKDVMSRRGGNVDRDALWNWICKHRSGTAKSMRAMKDEDKLSKDLDKEVGEFRKANNGTASGAVKPNNAQRPKQAPAARPARARAAAQISQPEAFRLPNGVNASIVSMDEYTQDACGIVMVNSFEHAAAKIIALKGSFTE